MIVSHKHKFIFLKTSKTGGSSLEAFLRKFCERGDIVTSLNEGEEQEMRAWGLCRPMGNFKIQGRVSLLNSMKIKFGNEASNKKFIGRHCVVAHSPASRVRQYVGESVWNSYFKFCIVRHPVDRTLSQYFWAAYSRGWTDAQTNFTERFDNFLQSKMFHPHLTRKGTNVYMEDGKVAVDYIGRFESLEDSVMHALAQTGLRIMSVSLPRFKSESRPKGDFAGMLLPRQRLLIQQTFAYEFENFGYR